VLTWGLIILACAGVAYPLARWATLQAEAHRRARLQKASLQELQTLAGEHDWDPDVFYWLGLRQAAAGHFEEAVQSLSRSASLNPQSARTRQALQAAMRQRNDLQLRQASVPQLMGIAAKNGSDPIVWYWLGVKLTQVGENRQAAQALGRSLALNPNSAPARATLGLALARAGYPREAEAQLLEAARRDPKLEFTFFTLGSLYGKYKRWEQAVAALKTATELNPKDREAQYLLAQAYGEIFLEDRKMDLLEQLVKQEPDNIQYLKSLGYVYIFFGKFADAEQTYRRILQLQPDDQETHYLLGRALAEQANTPEAFAVAEKELKAVVTKVPYEPGIYLALGILYFRRNEPARAIPDLERAIKLGVLEHKTWLYLGQSYMRVGRTEEGRKTLAEFQRSTGISRAISQLENRLLNTPDDTPEHKQERTEVQMRLVKVYMEDKNYSRALNHLRGILERDPKNAEALRLNRECETRLRAAGAAPANG
jgi:tetratricopeptide (TPR) repeat protein